MEDPLGVLSRRINNMQNADKSVLDPVGIRQGGRRGGIGSTVQTKDHPIALARKKLYWKL